MTPPEHRPSRPTFIAHAVVNVAVDPQELVAVTLTRRQGREFVTWHEDADNLRIRRAEVKLFQT